MDRSHHITLLVAENPAEDVVWTERIESTLAGLPDNVLGICYYGFTEMFNNVIDHSEAVRATVSVVVEGGEVSILIIDDGIGIFEKIRRGFNLANQNQAVFELDKGVTTDPKRHSGQGIFFTSRAFDTFAIRSGGLVFGHPPEGSDWLFDDDHPKAGTTVIMGINAESDRKLASVFNEYSSVDEGFTKTHIRVAMAKQGDGELVSRSQAKRVLAQCERFREIVLDFTDVDFIGQAFADEIFRVFRRRHPEVTLYPIHAGEQVMATIGRTEHQDTPTFESVAQQLGSDLVVEAARKLDRDLTDWRQRGMWGTPEAREGFLREMFHGARVTMRLLVAGKLVSEPNKTPLEILDAAIPEMLEFSRRQAIDTGYSEEETALFVETQRSAYEALRKEFGGS